MRVMREIFVVTHPEASHHLEGRVGGWFDSTLTPRGLKQTSQIADALSARMSPGSPIFTSDLTRARQAADAIATRLRSTALSMSELREKSYGVGEGQPDAWFRDRFVPPPARGERMNHFEGIEGAETKAEWVRRVYAGMEVVLRDPAPQKVIVTHGGSATFVVARWMRVPVTALDVMSFHFDAGGITHLREDDYFHNRTLVTLNEQTHLS